MALVKNSNAYSTVIEADAYFENSLDKAAWIDADEVTKAQALVSATQLLDELRWIGTVVNDSQELAFPRVGSYFDPRVGKVVQLEVAMFRVQTALYELAYHLLNNDGLLDDTGSVTSLELGSIKLLNIEKPSQIPAHIMRIVRPVLTSTSGHTWWRAN